MIRQETQLFGAEAAQTLRSRHARAICIRSMGRLDDAAAEGRVVLDGLRAQLGEKHPPDVLDAQHELAISLRDQGDNERAEKVFRQVLQLEEEALGIEHPSTLITRANLASALILRQKFTELNPKSGQYWRRGPVF
ncbi:tetratricopeptide repeat protein [Streptomyces sp. SID7803]|nr:tetratricopeptide repeat protein [Streptomyces sp. SID7803]